jgi:hypothetical protein
MNPATEFKLSLNSIDNTIKAGWPKKDEKTLDIKKVTTSSRAIIAAL